MEALTDSMYSLSEITDLLERLDVCEADFLEDQRLDFKEWDFYNHRASVDRVVEMAVCMANGGGGIVVFGVRDHAVGRQNAINGIPQDIDLNILRKAVYDRTDPKITPVFEEIRIPEGSGRLPVMRIFPGIPPYTDTSGKGKIRIGKDCQPLTGTLRKKIMVETGESDFTAEEIQAAPETAISSSAMEILRDIAEKEYAPKTFLELTDSDLLTALGLIGNGKLNRAGVLIAGKPQAIQTYVPGFVYTYLRMETDTQYKDRLDESEALPSALTKLMGKINEDNPIHTLARGLFHFEYRTYPEIALREDIMNAFCHVDFRYRSPITVKHFADRLKISNSGGYIGGISPDNILHHPPVSRNPALVDALLKIRLVDRMNLGVNRMFRALLENGQEPPAFRKIGDSVTVLFYRQDFSPKFRRFVEEENRAGRPPGGRFPIDFTIFASKSRNQFKTGGLALPAFGTGGSAHSVGHGPPIRLPRKRRDGKRHLLVFANRDATKNLRLG